MLTLANNIYLKDLTGFKEKRFRWIYIRSIFTSFSCLKCWSIEIIVLRCTVGQWNISWYEFSISKWIYAWSHTYNSDHVAASVYIRFHSPRCEGKSIHVFLSFSFCLAFTCAKTKFWVRYYDKQMWWPKNLCVSKTGIEQEKGIRSYMRTDGERLTWIKFLISPIAVINLTKI